MEPDQNDSVVPDRALLVRRATSRLCGLLAWAPLCEVTLPNGRRADILALRPDGGFVCIEIKSAARDFLADHKWPDYQDFCDEFYFAIDLDFPPDLLPTDVGLIVTAGLAAEIVREAPSHPLPGNRRRSLLLRFAVLAATRLATLEDPGAAPTLRGALRAD